MTQINWQYQVNNRAGGYIVTATDWNDLAGNFRALVDQTTGSGTTDNVAMPIGVDLVNHKVFISDPTSSTACPPEAANNTATAQLQVSSNAEDATIAITAAHDTEDTSPVLLMRKADGTQASPALVDDTAILGTIKFQGYDGNSWANGADIVAQVTGTAGDGDMPTRLLFRTSPDGAEAVATRMVITPEGYIGVGTTTPEHPLEISSTQNDDEAIRITNSNESATGTVYLGFAPRADSENSTNPQAAISGIEYDSADHRAHLAFYTNGSNTDSAPSERMRITAVGKVGIGSSSPSQKFLVYAANGWNSTNYIALFENADVTSTQGNVVQIKGGGTTSSTNSKMLDVLDMGGNTEFFVRGDGVTYLRNASKDAGTFDIPHPVKKGDWRLRHSLIEGPQADNIYRGTATINGSSAVVDLDAVSNMTDGTWEALNTNSWAMVSSSGNAVEWSLSGKTLTITGPDKAVCSWLVIGERHDPTIKNSRTRFFDDDGKLIVEAEDPDMPDSESYASRQPTGEDES